MKTLHRSLFYFLVILLPFFAVGQQTVSTNAALSTAICTASARTTIVLANGAWTNVQISINKTGRALSPIVI